MGNRGIRWKITNQLEDLDFADFIALISTMAQMQRETVNVSNNQ